MEDFKIGCRLLLTNDEEAEVIAIVPNGEDAISIFEHATGRKYVRLAEMDLFCDHKIQLRDRIWVKETGDRDFYHCIGPEKIKIAVLD